ncbi:MAG: FAD-dependent oxidoreductase [Acidobacteriota bacterium]
MSDAAVQSAAMPVLQNIFGSGIPSPTAIRVTRWLADSRSLGSYSLVPLTGTFPADQAALLATGWFLHRRRRAPVEPRGGCLRRSRESPGQWSAAGSDRQVTSPRRDSSLT